MAKNYKLSAPKKKLYVSDLKDNQCIEITSLSQFNLLVPFMCSPKERKAPIEQTLYIAKNVIHKGCLAYQHNFLNWDKSSEYYLEPLEIIKFENIILK